MTQGAEWWVNENINKIGAFENRNVDMRLMM